MVEDRPHYYVQNPARDDRTRLAKSIDILLSLLLVWLLVWFLASLTVMALPLPAVFSSLITILLIASGTALVVWYHRHKNNALRLHRDIWHSARKCRENFKELGHSLAFYELIKELMANTLPVTGLKVLLPNSDSTIALSGYVQNRKVGVMCINPGAEDHKTTAGDIKKFLSEIRQSGFDSGIVITTGSFSDEARRFARRIRGQAGIHLMDGHALLRMAKKAAHPVFPDEKWLEEKEGRLSGLEIVLSIKENILASRRKALSFVFLGLIFIVITALQNSFTGTVYMTIGVINLFIGFSGLILSYLRKHELLMDWL